MIVSGFVPMLMDYSNRHSNEPGHLFSRVHFGDWTVARVHLNRNWLNCFFSSFPHLHHYNITCAITNNFAAKQLFVLVWFWVFGFCCTFFFVRMVLLFGFPFRLCWTWESHAHWCWNTHAILGQKQTKERKRTSI